MSARAFEALLARLYTDEQARRDFLTDPRGTAARAGLEPSEIDSLAAIDRVGLELSAESFARKRATRGPRRSAWRRRLTGLALWLRA